MGPRIGIPLCLDERGRWKTGREYHYIDTAYARAVGESGGVAVHLPIQEGPAALVEQIDGLLLPGGDDFAPPRPYPAHVAFDLAPERQIAFDTGLLAAALSRRLPVLAICYGLQLLALQRGGRIHYHLPLDAPGASEHQLPEPGARHPVWIEPGSLLAGALRASPESVNSRHHQSVAEPGRGLRVAARSGDGLIEALECSDQPFCLGVQWHPETLPEAHRRRLFSAFVSACARSRAAGRAAAGA